MTKAKLEAVPLTAVLGSSESDVIVFIIRFLPPVLCGLGVLATGAYLKVDPLFWLGYGTIVVTVFLHLLYIRAIFLESVQNNREQGSANHEA